MITKVHKGRKKFNTQICSQEKRIELSLELGKTLVRFSDEFFLYFFSIDDHLWGLIMKNAICKQLFLITVKKNTPSMKLSTRATNRKIKPTFK